MIGMDKIDDIGKLRRSGATVVSIVRHIGVSESIGVYSEELSNTTNGLFVNCINESAWIT